MKKKTKGGVPKKLLMQRLRENRKQSLREVRAYVSKECYAKLKDVNADISKAVQFVLEDWASED